MLKKDVKLFEPGNYSQGNFPIEEVEKIFANVESVGAQFAHTSKLKKAGKEPLELGEFSNFKINEVGVVTADVEFNEKGETMYEDGTINGCSIELNKDGITKVAILPVGVEPAICGAEFDESGTFTFGGEMEFQEEPEPVTLGAIADTLNGFDMTTDVNGEFEKVQDAVWKLSDEKYSIKNLEKAGYLVTKPTSEFQADDIDAIKIKLEKQYEAKTNGTREFEKLKSEGKITKAMEDSGLTAEFMSMLESKKTDGDTLEFAESEFEFAKVFLDIIAKLPAKKLESELEISEFEKKKGDRLANAQRTVDLVNGTRK